MPSLLAAAESHHRHLAALEFTSLAFLPCAPTPIADPYTVPSDKGSDKPVTKASNPAMGNNNKRAILATATTGPTNGSGNSSNNSHAAKKKRTDE